MVLTLLPSGICRLCWNEIDERNFHCRPVWIGETAIPRVARRVVMPEVCDDCWGAFAEWCRATLGQKRREAQFSDVRKNAKRDAEMSWGEGYAERKYGRFCHRTLEEWLARSMGRIAGEIMGARTKAGRRHALAQDVARWRAQPRVKPRYPRMKDASA